MPVLRVTTVLCMMALPVFADADAADAERGRLLYENHCMTCHESVVHIRSDRKSQSLGEVNWQVSRWASEIKLDWRYEEVSAVVRYLNERFYRFEKPAVCP